MTIGAVIPGPVSAVLLASADFQARIAALATFDASVALPVVTFAADASAALAIDADLTAAIGVGIEPPTIDLQVSIMLALLATLRAQLAAIADLTSLFATAGVDLYAYDGPINAMGSEVATQFASETGHANALMLVARESATWTAMGSVFKTG